MYKHTFTHIHPYAYKYTYICAYTCMYAHTHIYIYIYISQHVDHPNINALCLGGGTKCSINQSMLVDYSFHFISLCSLVASSIIYIVNLEMFKDARFF